MWVMVVVRIIIITTAVIKKFLERVNVYKRALSFQGSFFIIYFFGML